MEHINIRKEISKGININILKTKKFKSNLISIYLIRPLRRDEVTLNALLPLVLKRGTKKYKTSIELEKALEELYGSNLSLGVDKKGEKQIIRFTIEGPNMNYVDLKDIFNRQVQIIEELLLNPYLKDNEFFIDCVEQEKKNLKNRIVGRLNNKKQFAIDRCIEEMCNNEYFGIYKYGYIEDLNKINAKNLYEHYLKILKTSQIEIFIVGDIDETKDISVLYKMFKFKRGDIVNLKKEEVIKNVTNIKEKIEEMDINQSKLTLGYRINIPYDDELYESYLIASYILGGGPDSKLFLNVREKESLAYYIYSKTFKFKSIMIITSGIEFNNYDKTLKIVKEQIESIKSGNFSKNDIENAKNSIITSIKNITDDNFTLSEFLLSKVLSNDNRSINEIISKLNSIDKEKIIDSFKNLKLDTIYFLKSKINQMEV